MATISRTFPRISGHLTIAIATLVSGPRVASVTGAGAGAQSIDQEVHAVLRRGWAARLRQVSAVDSALAVDEFGARRLPHHGPRAAGMDGHFGPAGQVPDTPRVALRPVEGHVAGDGGDPQQVERIGRRHGQEKGHGIVLAGVAIDDQRTRGHGEGAA